MIDPKDNGRVATPFRISFIGRTAQSLETLRDNILANRHVPQIEQAPPHGRKLAIVGGGPSVSDHIATLKAWDGDIWAINRMPRFLGRFGIAPTLITVDACDVPEAFCEPEEAQGAIFASWCAPNIVSRFDGARIVHMEPLVPGGIFGASTTAGSAPLIALSLGYTDITWFGCEGSFSTRDHAFEHVGEPHQLVVRAWASDFRTYPEFLTQCQEIASILKAFPDQFHEESGGLLRAITKDDQWSIVAVSGPLKQHLEEINGPQGLYETFYRWAA